MDIIEIWKYVAVFLSCTVFFSKVGMTAAVAVFKFHYLKCIITSCAGGIFSTVIFTYLSAGIIKWWEKLKSRWYKSHVPKKRFTKSNRRIIKIVHRFGLSGIAFLTPSLLSMPVGAFLGERFYRKKGKVILYISISTFLWSNALYFIYLAFYSSLKSWFE